MRAAFLLFLLVLVVGVCLGFPRPPAKYAPKTGKYAKAYVRPSKALPKFRATFPTYKPGPKTMFAQPKSKRPLIGTAFLNCEPIKVWSACSYGKMTVKYYAQKNRGKMCPPLPVGQTIECTSKSTYELGGCDYDLMYDFTRCGTGYAYYSIVVNASCNYNEAVTVRPECSVGVLSDKAALDRAKALFVKTAVTLEPIKLESRFDRQLKPWSSGGRSNDYGFSFNTGKAPLLVKSPRSYGGRGRYGGNSYPTSTSYGPDPYGDSYQASQTYGPDQYGYDAYQAAQTYGPDQYGYDAYQPAQTYGYDQYGQDSYQPAQTYGYDQYGQDSYQPAQTYGYDQYGQDSYQPAQTYGYDQYGQDAYPAAQTYGPDQYGPDAYAVSQTYGPDQYGYPVDQTYGPYGGDTYQPSQTYGPDPYGQYDDGYIA